MRRDGKSLGQMVRAGFALDLLGSGGAATGAVHPEHDGLHAVVLPQLAQLAGQYDIVGLNESDPGSLRSGFTNQTHYLAERAGFGFWSHQPNRRVLELCRASRARRRSTSRSPG